MTSKNSFWANCRENHKRRIWVWIVAVLSQLLLYGGITMIYMSRIKNFYAEGRYKTQEAFLEGLQQAAKDALGFSDNLYSIVILLGALIAMQGFSYLYDRRKVDLYHSVPVTKNRRFAVVYVNGLVIYLTANLTGIIFGMAIAASQGGMSGEVAVAAAFSFLLHLVLFLVFYHMMILAVMLTGNRFVTVCAFLTLALYEYGVNLLLNSMKAIFFETYTNYFVDSGPKLSVIYDCDTKIWRLKELQEYDVAAMTGNALPIMGKWCVIAAVLLALAYAAYKKRPSEAAGKAIAYPFLEPVVKVAVAVPAALMVGRIVYSTSYGNEMLEVLGMLAGGVICCAALEVLYDFDIRSLFRHLLSSGIALAGILVIFCIFRWDIFGYDTYVPEQNKVESIAILADGYYDSYWDENFNYVDGAKFIKEHMFLTDTEPVITLAKTFLQADPEEMTERRVINVLYRLTSGRQVVREIHVDYADAEAERLLNQILKTEEYKTGLFQVMTDETSYDRAFQVTYQNGAVSVAIPTEEIWRLREAWIKDMEQFDFTLARHSLACGQISITYVQNQSTHTDYRYGNWTVYENFTNTIACLKELGAYYPMQLDAADVDSVTVTCYHNELAEQGQDVISYDTARGDTAWAVQEDGVYVDYSVRETFYEEEQIARILPHLQASDLYSQWNSYDAVDRNYSVEIVFKKDTAYPYMRDSYYFRYHFINGQVPDFVAEATAYTE